MEGVSSEQDRTTDRLIEATARNTTRLEGLAAELLRARDAIHVLQGSAAAAIALGQQVAELARQLDGLTAELRTLSRRAVERPTPAGYSAAAGWVSVLLAFAAILIATLR
jgi:hypothetical protein